jgi:outer membrane protein TolC
MVARRCIAVLVVCALAGPHLSVPALAQGILGTVLPEQRRMAIRSPSQMPAARLPSVPVPPTVTEPGRREPLELSLDDAIRIALMNSQVVRVLTGTGAASSGRTIYDPAISNTQIDQARGRFDPNIQVQNDFDRIETPRAGFDPADPTGTQARIEGDRIDQYNLGLGVAKATAGGGTASLDVRANPLRSSADGLPLNPQSISSVDIGFSQPLLQGGGTRARHRAVVLSAHRERATTGRGSDRGLLGVGLRPR